MNMRPNNDATTSNESSVTRRAWPPMAAVCTTVSPCTADLLASFLSIPAEKSVANTSAPRRAAAKVKAPVPAATSSTREPGFTCTRRTASSANWPVTAAAKTSYPSAELLQASARCSGGIGFEVVMSAPRFWLRPTALLKAAQLRQRLARLQEGLERRQDWRPALAEALGGLLARQLVVDECELDHALVRFDSKAHARMPLFACLRVELVAKRVGQALGWVGFEHDAAVGKILAVTVEERHRRPNGPLRLDPSAVPICLRKLTLGERRPQPLWRGGNVRDIHEFWFFHGATPARQIQG